MKAHPLYRWLQRVWYGNGRGGWLLLPLAALYWLTIRLRRALYAVGLLPSTRIPRPVIVVGNITAGGTGKTPVTVWLAAALHQHGFRPGLVSRGYGGSHSRSPMRVDAASDPAVVGDEPVLLARRSGLPVVVDRDRVRAAQMLTEDGCDVIIADDGLQHLRLQRDYEICVIDGSRWLGNRRVLPAGPLRETAARLSTVDQILVNGEGHEDARSATEQNAIPFVLQATEVCRLNGSLSRPIDGFAGSTVHAVAAIGNPQRFFDSLRAAGLQVIEHVWPDHARIELSAIAFDDEFPVLMTEKDAVKFGSRVADRYWYVPVELQMDAALEGPWLAQIVTRLRTLQERI